MKAAMLGDKVSALRVLRQNTQNGFFSWTDPVV
jgi:hypothetical protein